MSAECFCKTGILGVIDDPCLIIWGSFINLEDQNFFNIKFHQDMKNNKCLLEQRETASSGTLYWFVCIVPQA